MVPRHPLAVCLVALAGSLSAQTYLPEARTAPTTKAPIRQVTFHNDSALPRNTEEEIVRQLRGEAQASWSRQDVSGLAEQAAERVRAAYQDDGYFKAQVAARAVRVVEAAKSEYDIAVQIESAGQRYRLGNLNFTNETVFPSQQLRDLFPIERGEIFRREKIAKGLEQLRCFYGSQGYINYTGLPETEFDDNTAVANLTIDVDEGRLFYWGDLHVDGMHDQDSEILLRAWEGMRGQVYSADGHELDRFLKQFFYPVRKGTNLADSAIKKTDEAKGTVDIYLNLIWNPDIVKRTANLDGPIR